MNCVATGVLGATLHFFTHSVLPAPTAGDPDTRYNQQQQQAQSPFGWENQESNSVFKQPQISASNPSFFSNYDKEGQERLPEQFASAASADTFQDPWDHPRDQPGR
jgi:hypothetical protein